MVWRKVAVVLQERLEAIVGGRVHGVGFRFFVEAEALLIGGIKGFARNLPDGTVEVIAEGEGERLERLLRCIEKGPPTGRVESVKKHWGVPRRGFKGFSIL